MEDRTAQHQNLRGEMPFSGTLPRDGTPEKYPVSREPSELRSHESQPQGKGWDTGKMPLSAANLVRPGFHTLLELH